MARPISIVRTEATRLRGALARYYAGEGAADAIRIVLPPGSYIPRFERCPPVEASNVGVEEEPEAAQPPAQTRPAPPSARGRILVEAAAALMVVLAVAAAFALQFRLPFAAGASIAPTVVVAMTQPIEADPKIHTLALGLTESLVLSLNRYQGLSVAKTSEGQNIEAIVASRRGKGGSVYILESSIDADDAQLRFRWRLVDLEERTVLWSDKINEALSDSSSLNVEDRISEGVARIVGVRGGILALAEQRRGQARSTAGYACFLLGMSYMSSLAVDVHAQARDCLERTVAQEPENAEALALLSYIYVDEDRNGYNPRGSREAILARATGVSDRAAHLAPLSSFVQQMRSTVLFYIKNYPGFERAARKSIELNPGDPHLRVLFGNRLFALGRYEEGVTFARQGLAMDPFPPAISHAVTLLDAYRLGNYRAAAQEAASLDAQMNFYLAHVLLAAIYGQLEDKGAADKEVASLLELRPDYPKTFRFDWRNRDYREDLIDKVAEGLRKAGLRVE